jgi:hypothetical protein
VLLLLLLLLKLLIASSAECVIACAFVCLFYVTEEFLSAFTNQSTLLNQQSTPFIITGQVMTEVSSFLGVDDSFNFATDVVMNTRMVRGRDVGEDEYENHDNADA